MLHTHYFRTRDERAVSGLTAEDRSDKRAAVAALFETHYHRVARYIAVRIGDPGEAEDLASEVFLRAVRSVDAYQERGVPLEVWVFRIARNVAIDALRKRARRPPSVSVEIAETVAGTSDPAAEAEQRQRVHETLAAVSTLTQAQRQVLALRFGGGMNCEQIAQVLGKRAGSVREMQSAALKRLRRRFLSDASALSHSPASA